MASTKADQPDPSADIVVNSSAWSCAICKATTRSCKRDIADRTGGRVLPAFDRGAWRICLSRDDLFTPDEQFSADLGLADSDIAAE